MRNNEIIGYSKFKSKSGNDVMFVDIAKLPTDRDIQWGRVGMKVEQVWIPAHCFDLFSSSVIGMVLKCDYEIFNGRANVIGVSFE